MARIESAVFSDPWPGSAFASLLGDLAVVAEQDGIVAGYGFGIHAADEGEILNLATAPQFRRRGIARAIVTALLDRLERAGAKTVFLEVRASNTEGRALYASFGFHAVGRRPRYYTSPPEDALVLARRFEGGGEHA